ncbi:3-hydroxyisobutyryl-CoA hydrolase 1 [Melia azedarach]|uniref:3-hydroxyisobutyryl-CoA hydrolase 1 n=1 Tax=Melia azedarach TaxID=155640 RepID=A0ACC1X9J2_MELAZ|nr:3-hydroxyisobutyryl-CoA hydrolase 1 [Melia azedarach]
MAFSDSSFDELLFEGKSSVKKVILNRPEKMNSMTFEMVSQMLKKFKVYENDSTVKFVILKGNGRGFCSGGDIRLLYKYTTAGHWSFAARFYKNILTLNYLLATYQKPLVAIINGIVMGGGAGMSMYAKFKIVSENTVFAMPEAGIGHFPDTGATHFLSRLPGYFGEYLGLTGSMISGAEMVACGLATHFVLSKDLHLLENALEELSSSDTTAISHLIRKFVPEKLEKQDNFYNRLQIINECFSRETVEDMLLAFEKQKEIYGEEKWIVEAINSMKSACPNSLKICLRSIRDGRSKSYEECLVDEYTIYCHILRRTVNGDFFEGLRAKVIDKDNKPKWQHPKLEQVTDEIVDRYFSKVDEDDWEFLQLPPRPKVFDFVTPKL